MNILDVYLGPICSTSKIIKEYIDVKEITGEKYDIDGLREIKLQKLHFDIYKCNVFNSVQKD